MCGITGFSDAALLTSDDINTKKAIENNRQALLAARDAIHHRGPDDSGIYYDPAEGVGLAHTRLSIIDLSVHGRQPMSTDDGLVTIVYNGEIYNFRELRAELEKEGIEFCGHSDTEVLLQLYLAARHELSVMLRRLNGIFSLAIWDARYRVMFLARDAIGVKPLYIAEQGKRIAFASELKGVIPLLQTKPQVDDLDIESLLRYSTYWWCPGDGTPLKSVRKINPGELIVVRHGRIESCHTWYHLPVFRGIRPELTKSESINGVRKHLRKAVHRQLVADVPVGAFLSGGLDSSSIVALAREQQPDIQCFTIETTGGQEEGFSDDLPYAKKVAEHLHVPLEVVRVDSDHMIAGLKDMVAQLDEPLADPAPLNVLFISQLARAQGIKVLLSGAGGDDIFTGYRRHYAVQVGARLRWLPQPVKQLLQKYSSTMDQRISTFRRFAKFFDAAVQDGDEQIAHYFSWARRKDLMPLYSREIRNKLLASRAAAPMTQFLSEMPSESSSLQRMLSLDQRFFLPDHNLNYTDKMSMAVGVEVRVPFLDIELIDFAAQIPDCYKQRGATGKWVLKKAMEPYIPHEVIYRPKSGFGAPLRRWMRYELRELLGDLLSKERIRSRGLFDPVAVQNLIRENDIGAVDASYTLLTLMCIELWCDQYISK